MACLPHMHRYVNTYILWYTRDGSFWLGGASCVHLSPSLCLMALVWPTAVSHGINIYIREICRYLQSDFLFVFSRKLIGRQSLCADNCTILWRMYQSFPWGKYIPRFFSGRCLKLDSNVCFTYKYIIMFDL